MLEDNIDTHTPNSGEVLMPSSPPNASLEGSQSDSTATVPCCTPPPTGGNPTLPGNNPTLTYSTPIRPDGNATRLDSAPTPPGKHAKKNKNARMRASRKRKAGRESVETEVSPSPRSKTKHIPWDGSPVTPTRGTPQYPHSMEGTLISHYRAAGLRAFFRRQFGVIERRHQLAGSMLRQSGAVDVKAVYEEGVERRTELEQMLCDIPQEEGGWMGLENPDWRVDLA
ncbi:hypothetical protein CspeluHIS016_0111510 [Cutaneotrichosporon spelunceum]|uniref:Uncharacterized protein n=1 Tax=Cutaneotrichosporon spelunceum TaxID=1672016 RepID=A0AAD3TQJ9_9TREE|nr:hypothetical protein CspeluHIS016_0111510 [Cutaneotrichosporon spelunceum]